MGAHFLLSENGVKNSQKKNTFLMYFLKTYVHRIKLEFNESS